MPQGPDIDPSSKSLHFQWIATRDAALSEPRSHTSPPRPGPDPVPRARLTQLASRIQQPVEPLRADHIALAHRLRPLDELVTQALMVALAVVVLQVLLDTPPQVPLTEQDHPAQALLLD